MSIPNTRRMKRRPTHPGELLREDFLPESGLSAAGLAEAVGVSRRRAVAGNHGVGREGGEASEGTDAEAFKGAAGAAHHIDEVGLLSRGVQGFAYCLRSVHRSSFLGDGRPVGSRVNRPGQRRGRHILFRQVVVHRAQLMSDPSLDFRVETSLGAWS